MGYEAELDTQIAALEKEIERRKRIRDFWEKNIPGKDKLLKKWKPMLENIMLESNKIEVAMNLEIMHVLAKKNEVEEIQTYVMPILARCDKDGNSWK